MKSDILLRAEAMALESSDEENSSKDKYETDENGRKVRVIGFEDEDDDLLGEDGFRETKVPTVKGVARMGKDGEESGEDEESEGEQVPVRLKHAHI